MDTLQRALVFILAFLLVGTAGARGQLPGNELEGTWRMVKQERVYSDSTVDHSDRWGPGFKILNSTHFAWGRETEDGSEVLAGGGWYEYYPEKNLYIEHIQYHSETDFAGQTLEFTAKVNGDTWVHIGDVGDYKLREVWKRVDPETVRTPMAGSDSEGTPDTDDGGQ